MVTPPEAVFAFKWALLEGLPGPRRASEADSLGRAGPLALVSRCPLLRLMTSFSHLISNSRILEGKLADLRVTVQKLVKKIIIIIIKGLCNEKL